MDTSHSQGPLLTPQLLTLATQASYNQDQRPESANQMGNGLVILQLANVRTIHVLTDYRAVERKQSYTRALLPILNF